MSARGFGSVIWAGAVAGAALGFYLVSLKVASERAELEDVETRIALAQRDIRLLQTEIGTRGRLAQLERWNVRFIRLSAPTADQFVEGGFRLASLVAPQQRPAIEAPVVLASATIGQTVSRQPGLATGGESPRDRSEPSAAGEMMHVASYAVPPRQTTAPSAAGKPGPVPAPGVVAPGTAKRNGPATKPAKSAMADPLAPLPSRGAKAKGGSSPASAGGSASQGRMTKDLVTDR